MVKYLGNAAAAKLLGVTPARVRQLWAAGLLPAAAEIDQINRVERIFDPAAVEGLRFQRERAKSLQHAAGLRAAKRARKDESQTA